MTKRKRTIYVGVNDRGLPVGESHPRSTVSDSDVERMRDMYEKQGMTHKEIGRTLGYSKSTVSKICSYQRRTQVATRSKRVTVYDGG